MKESKILKTAGILMIIGGVLEVIAGIWASNRGTVRKNPADVW